MYSNIEIAEKFNEYFSSLYEPDETDFRDNSLKESNFGDTLSYHISEIQVHNVLKSLSNSSQDLTEFLINFG